MKEPRKRTPANAPANSATERKQSARKSAGQARRGGSMPRGTDEDIRARAYQLYLERGGTPGREMEDWLRAEHEYRQRSGDGGTMPDRPMTSPPSP